MKKGDSKYRNYAYLVYANDTYELPMFVADKLEGICSYLNISLSAVSHYINRNNKVRIKNRIIERVKIYDYVYIIFETDISHPLFVARDMQSLIKKSGYSMANLDRVLYNRPRQPSKKGKIQICKLEGKYFVKCIDLLDLDINLANFLNSCADKETITPGEIEEFNKELNF